jgi:hypothetical protein
MPRAVPGGTVKLSGAQQGLAGTRTTDDDLGEVPTMRTPAPPHPDLAALDEQIVRALAALRWARTACTAASTPMSIARREQTEADLDALLDRRYAAQHRVPA